MYLHFSTILFYHFQIHEILLIKHVYNYLYICEYTRARIKNQLIKQQQKDSKTTRPASSVLESVSLLPFLFLFCLVLCPARTYCTISHRTKICCCKWNWHAAQSASPLHSNVVKFQFLPLPFWNFFRPQQHTHLHSL